MDKNLLDEILNGTKEHSSDLDFVSKLICETSDFVSEYKQKFYKVYALLMMVVSISFSCLLWNEIFKSESLLYVNNLPWIRISVLSILVGHLFIRIIDKIITIILLNKNIYQLENILNKYCEDSKANMIVKIDKKNARHLFSVFSNSRNMFSILRVLTLKFKIYNT